VLSVLARERFVAGEREFALLALEQVLERHPNHGLTLFRYATSLSRMDRFEESLAVMSRVVERDPLNANRRGEYAMSLYGAGRTEEAKAEARRAVELEPDMAWGWGLLSAWESADGHLDEAIIYNRKRLYVLGDSSMRLDHGCGFSYAALGATEEAMVRLEKCVEVVASANLPGQAFVALELLRRHDLGVEYARQLAAVAPDDPEFSDCTQGHCKYRLLGYLQAGEPEQAWAFYRRAAPVDFTRGEAILAGADIENDDFMKWDLVLYAWLLLQTRQEDKARALLQRMVAFWDEKCIGSTTAQRRSASFHQCRSQYVLHGFLGQREATLAMLRRTYIEDGWPYRWSFYEDHGALNFLQDDPEYLEIMQVVEDRLAVQRERIRELERNGELPMAQWEIDARRALAAQAQAETTTAGLD
jgi:tetratricopeptide (TPR) repeat protein